MFTRKPKTVLPLSHGEALRQHMQVFHETMDNLTELELCITEELGELENQVETLKTDRENVQSAIKRVRQVTG